MVTLRPGQRIATIPRHGMTVTQGRATLTAGGISLTNFFTASYTGTRNNFSGYVGYRFTPASNFTIVALGRSVSTSITTDHKVRVYRTSDYAVLAEVTVNGASPVDGLGYAYEMLGTPLAVTSGTIYHIASREYSGGDLWRDLASIASHSALAAVNTGCYSFSADGAPTGTFGAVNEGYVPTTFYT